MPNIRVLNWNIERLSANKLAIPGIANNIGQVISDSQADIVILLEVSAHNVMATMATVSLAANIASIAAGGLPNVNNYTAWLVSYQTGGECYGLLIRNLNVVRPIRVTGGPTGADTDNANNAALNNLDRNRFGTWPGTFGGLPNAYPVPAPAGRPRLPLNDVYASLPNRRAAQRGRFAGRTLANGGYALGMGFRMPCLMMFEILGAPPNPYLVPILVCHLGAVRGGANRLARGQIRQYKTTHIAQKFMNPIPLVLPYGGYVDLNNAATPIQQLIITGDFNVDFLQQNPPPPASNLRTGNRSALNTLTPSTVGAGSALPAANPGNPTRYNPINHVPIPGIPAVPFVIMGPPGPSYLAIPDLVLKSAATSQGTILVHYDQNVVPPGFPALRGACFDNFFFGGTQLSAIYQVLTLPADACEVTNLPARLGHAPIGALALNVSGAWTYHILPPVTRDASAAPNLAPAAIAPLTMNDRLIGTRFISDHLPTLVQFNLP